MSWNASFQAGVRLGRSRLSALSVSVIAVCGVGLSTLAGFAEYRESALHAPDRALQGPTFGLAVPLVTLAMIVLVTGNDNLKASTRSLTWLGARRDGVATGLLTVGVAVAGVVNVLLGIGAAVASHGARGPGLWADVGTVTWLALLATLSYGGLFALGSTFGRRGGWRGWLWLGDLWIGTMTGWGALIAPRAHTLNLLGGTSVAHVSQALSIAALGVLAVALWTATVVRTGK